MKVYKYLGLAALLTCLAACTKGKNEETAVITATDGSPCAAAPPCGEGSSLVKDERGCFSKCVPEESLQPPAD